jgi:hypothetical protein
MPWRFFEFRPTFSCHSHFTSCPGLLGDFSVDTYSVRTEEFSILRIVPPSLISLQTVSFDSLAWPSLTGAVGQKAHTSIPCPIYCPWLTGFLMIIPLIGSLVVASECQIFPYFTGAVKIQTLSVFILFKMRFDDCLGFPSQYPPCIPSTSVTNSSSTRRECPEKIGPLVRGSHTRVPDIPQL